MKNVKWEIGNDPVASTTPSGLPAWGPRSAPGSVPGKRRIEINYCGGAGDAFVILRAHLWPFRSSVGRGLQLGKIN